MPVHGFAKAWTMSPPNRAKPSKIEPPPSIPTVLSDTERWYCVHTLPLREIYAQRHLQNQGFRTFLPKRRKTIHHARKLRTVGAAFFPRYLFTVLDMTCDQWRSVNSTFGVSRLVMRGDEPHPVPCGVVEVLIATTDAGGILQFGEKLEVGGTVRLLSGAFAEQLAILDHLDEAGRVRVLLDILGRQVPISTNSNNLLPLTETRQ
jgi:transcription elongation factor/antiterminator RfaH